MTTHNPHAPKITWPADEVTTFRDYASALNADELAAGQVLEDLAMAAELVILDVRIEEASAAGRLINLTLQLTVMTPYGNVAHLDAVKSNYRGLPGTFSIALSGDQPAEARDALNDALKPVLDRARAVNGSDDYCWADLAAALLRGDDRDYPALRRLGQRQMSRSW